MIISGYSYFLFDIDNTIWDFTTNANEALRRVVTDFHIPAGSFEEFYEIYEPHNKELWRKYDTLQITKEFLCMDRFLHPLEHYGISDKKLAEKMGAAYLVEMVKGLVLMPGALQVLQKIREQGGHTAILSNGFKEVQQAKITNCHLRDFFDEIVISEEVGVGKPDTDIYKIALQRLLVHSTGDPMAAADSEALEEAKKRTIMVGDNPLNDIEAASDFGIDQFFLNPSAAPGRFRDGFAPTYESDTLLELIKDN